MTKWIKKTIKGLLARRGYHLTWCQPGVPSGLDLRGDLQILIRSENPVILDVGANRGQTIEMLCETFVSPQIFAFEPSLSVFNELQREHGDRCRNLFHMALGAHDDVKEFINYERSEFSSFHRLAPSALHELSEIKVRSIEQVQVRSLDSLFPELGEAEIDLLKIDTQGHDLDVLKGARMLFQQGVVKRVLVEMNFVPMYEGEGAALEIMSFLGGHRLSLVNLYETSHGGGVLTWCTALFQRVDK
jgi:FkbM family methyltransferase